MDLNQIDLDNINKIKTILRKYPNPVQIASVTS